MQTEKQRERLVELLNEATFGVNVHTLADHLSKETIERVADYLIANGVTVEIKQEDMTKNLLSLFEFSKAVHAERVELQKDEYLYLLEYMEKAENVLKERKENEDERN